MSRVYYIRDARGERQLTEAELPLALGGADNADIVLPGVAADAIVAHFAMADGHAYIQPADPSQALFHNHEQFTGSRWLKSGDRVQVNDSVVSWTVQGDQVSIAVQQHVPVLEITPPATPPPGAVSSNRALPVVDNAAPAQIRASKTRRLITGLFVVLVLAAVFVLLATPVAITVTPAPDSQSLQGFPPPVTIGGRQMVLPGRYTVHAVRNGYRPLEASVTVQADGFQEFSFELQELPGRITLSVDPVVPFRLLVDGDDVPVDADNIAEITRGTHLLRIETDRYLPAETSLQINGLGEAQTVAFTLQPGWADIKLTSKPAGAEVRFDDEAVGVTPLQAEILYGPRVISLSLEQYKPFSLQQVVEAGKAIELKTIELQPADGQLALASKPAGATVSVDGTFHGTTPATLTLSAREVHKLRLSKPGYQGYSNSITLEPEAIQELDVNLSPQYGVVFVTSRPADASLKIDGKPSGKATQRLRLTTRSHTLEVSKPGYATQRLKVTARTGSSQNVDVTLKTEAEARVVATPATLTSAGGQVLKLIRPAGSFSMGASRREAGRRANESARLVQLTRPFYFGIEEVTNGEYRRFRKSHGSGSSEGVNLNADDLPVANVSWDDAARYCNWLSQKDKLPPAYREAGDRMIAVSPMTTGYRLPSEAEWAYIARVHGRSSASRYPWAGSYPPTSMAGNYADARIADTLANVVPGYDDGYRGSAPGGRFAAQPAGFYDLGGNVAEWIHDYYAVYPGMAQQLVTDPTGPATGDHHVVRGSSWRSGSIAELRLSYRDYSRGPRADLGFRIARYAE